MMIKRLLGFSIFLIMATSLVAQQTDYSYIPYRNADKWGFSSSDKEIIIKPVYSEVHWFSYGLAAVKMGNKWGYINTAGKMVIPARYTVAKDFTKGYMPKANNPRGDTLIFAGVSLRPDKYEICINAKGVTMPQCPAISDNAGPNGDQPIRTIKIKKTYSLDNSSGLFDKIVDDYKIADSNETYYIAEKGGKYGVYNSKFATIVPFEYDDISIDDSTGETYLRVVKNDLIGVLSKNGNVLIQPENTTLHIVRTIDGKHYVVTQRGLKHYVKDINNQDIISDGFLNIEYDGHGFIFTNDQNLKGYYFLNTGRRILPHYKSIEYMPNDKFLKVTTGSGRTGYVSVDGTEYFKD